MTCNANYGSRSDTMYAAGESMVLPYIMEVESGSVKGCGCLVAGDKLYFL